MRGSFFRSMTWLHTWAGLLTCWLLFLVFFAGTLSYFRHEITWWMQPQSHGLKPVDYTQHAAGLSRALNLLNERAPDATSWVIDLPTERQPLLHWRYREAAPPGERRASVVKGYLSVDGDTQWAALLDTKGGEFFYRLHFDLHYISPMTARWVVGAAAMVMLVGLITGLVIHRRIFADFFTFRAGKGAKTWLDLHNLSAVFALPFHLMITYTGLLTLMFMYMPAPVEKVYPGGMAGFFSDQNPTFKPVARAGQPLSQPVDWQQLIGHFKDNKELAAISRISIDNPADINARITLYGKADGVIAHYARASLYDASGEVLGTTREAQFYAAERTANTMIALHTAQFSPWSLRWLFVVGGILGCVMVASGGILWARRLVEKNLRLGRPPGWNLRLVQGMNLATVVGLPLSAMVFLYLNRLLPAGLDARAEWEINGFFISFALTLVLALIRADHKSWALGWLLVAAMALALPMVNAMTTNYHLIAYLQSRQWPLAALELCVMLGGIVALWGAACCAKSASSAPGQSRSEAYC
ncbi:PepSY domain-containing protein [Bowmanella sp. Y26]|uniref:PepSY-associated TM helix domain-containing protein n=1 Tax=Bowmanella yangjiangensis TaxID=2811230 RepID=UPI001BDBB747|nr:PepSY-associated TM helix domain-containing protein [Bowmanella yangjiangensis]MBT1064516.1 PepSY domain-containing protein [Bowmanella yangjiangensis]